MNVEKWIFIGCVTWKNCGASSAQEGALQSDQAFQKMLTSNYSTDFGENQQLMQNLSNNLGTIINAGAGQQGFSPEESAAMNSQAVNDAAAANQKAQVAIGNTAAAHGAANPGVESGITQAEQSSAATAANTQENNQLADITKQNYATGRQNYWNAVGEQAKLPSEFENPSSKAASTVTSSNNATSDQANQNAASNNAWMGMVSGLAGDAASSFGAYEKASCWIAAATFDGWDDPRTSIVRNFLYGDFRESWYGKALTDLYTKFGQRLSKSRVAMFFFRPIFRAVLKHAVKE